MFFCFSKDTTLWIFHVWPKARLHFSVTRQHYCICPFCQGQSVASKISVHLSCSSFSEHDSRSVLCEHTAGVSGFPSEGVKEKLLRKDGQSWNQSRHVQELSLSETPYVPHPTYCLSGHIDPLWEHCSGVVRVGQETPASVFLLPCQTGLNK